MFLHRTYHIVPILAVDFEITAQYEVTMADFNTPKESSHQ